MRLYILDQLESERKWEEMFQLATASLPEVVSNAQSLIWENGDLVDGNGRPIVHPALVVCHAGGLGDQNVGGVTQYLGHKQLMGLVISEGAAEGVEMQNGFCYRRAAIVGRYVVDQVFALCLNRFLVNVVSAGCRDWKLIEPDGQPLPLLEVLLLRMVDQPISDALFRRARSELAVYGRNINEVNDEQDLAHHCREVMRYVRDQSVTVRGVLTASRLRHSWLQQIVSMECATIAMTDRNTLMGWEKVFKAQEYETLLCELVEKFWNEFNPSQLLVNGDLAFAYVGVAHDRQGTINSISEGFLTSCSTGRVLKASLDEHAGGLVAALHSFREAVEARQATPECWLRVLAHAKPVDDTLKRCCVEVPWSQ